MVWLSGALGAAKEFFALLRQHNDPDNKRLRTIAQVDKELKKIRKKRDALLIKEAKDENEKESLAIDLGVITDRIIFLRRKRSSLER